MKIYFDKDTNEIVGTVEGFEDNGVSISLPGRALEEVNIGLGHKLEKWARDLEDTRKPHISVKNHRFDGKKFIRIPDTEIQAKKAAQEEARERFKQERAKLIEKIKDENLSADERLNAVIKHLNI